MNKDIINDIREGKIDINNQELFFSKLIKGFIQDIDNVISIRGKKVPHILAHTGGDIMYLENKGYDFSKEPEQVTNEDYIYNVVPRCNITLGSIDLLSDQLTNPYTLGNLQFENKDSIINLKGEYRRMPIKLGIELRYCTDTFRDMLELIQQIISKLVFVRTYNIIYMGQSIVCSYKIPENFQSEHLADLEGTTIDDKSRTLSLSIELETNFPVFAEKTIMRADSIITNYRISTSSNFKNDEFSSQIIIKNTDEIN